jgi:hypothetical protein
MAGALTISTLNDSSGVLATQNGMTGIAKAWVNFDGTGTPAIRGSFNVSSITDNGTGDYTVNFTTAMPNANYSISGTTMRSVAAGTALQMMLNVQNDTTYSNMVTTTFVKVKTPFSDGVTGIGDPLAVFVSICGS